MLIATVFVFVGLLLALVLVHEAGHFFAAKRAGCKVEEFGFGFPPRLFSITRGGTTYSFNLLPIGGFVKIEGEDMEEAVPGPYSFASKSAPWRIFILSAGVLMNVVLAAVVLSVQATLGSPTVATAGNASELTDITTYVLDVVPGSPAESAGLKTYDRVLRIDDVTQPSVTQVQDVVTAAEGNEIRLEVERAGIHTAVTVVPRANPPANEGALGVTLIATGLEKTSWWQAPWVGVQKTGQMLVAIVVQFWQLLQRLLQDGTVGEALTGPVGIAIYTNEVTRQGISYILEFAALVSLNLAIVNILPLPALDGGRIVFVTLESLFGRRLPIKIERVTHTVGFVLLIVLMLLITFRDIKRYF